MWRHAAHTHNMVTTHFLTSRNSSAARRHESRTATTSHGAAPALLTATACFTLPRHFSLPTPTTTLPAPALPASAPLAPPHHANTAQRLPALRLPCPTFLYQFAFLPLPLPTRLYRLWVPCCGRLPTPATDRAAFHTSYIAAAIPHFLRPAAATHTTGELLFYSPNTIFPFRCLLRTHFVSACAFTLGTYRCCCLTTVAGFYTYPRTCGPLPFRAAPALRGPRAFP